MDIFDVYLDESSQTKHRHLVLGGIVCPKASSDRLTENILNARQPELPHGELKWTKVSLGKLGAYKRVVDVFFDGIEQCEPLHFHSLTVDTTLRNEHAFNDGNREIGFNKEIYQLIMKFGRLYRQCGFHVYPDERKTASSTEELRLILNRGIAKKGDARDWPFRRLHFRKSHETPILQLNDLLIGAIAYHLNGHRQEDGASPAKCELSDHVIGRARVVNVMRDTSIGGKFTIWHRRLRVVPRA